MHAFITLHHLFSTYTLKKKRLIATSRIAVTHDVQATVASISNLVCLVLYTSCWAEINNPSSIILTIL